MTKFNRNRNNAEPARDGGDALSGSDADRIEAARPVVAGNALLRRRLRWHHRPQHQ